MDELGLLHYPVLETPGETGAPAQWSHGPVPAYDIKELKKVITEYELKSLYVKLRFKDLAHHILTPNYWRIVFQALVEPGDYVIFLSLLTERMQKNYYTAWSR